MSKRASVLSIVAGLAALMILAGCAAQPTPYTKDNLLTVWQLQFKASTKNSGAGSGLFKSVAKTWSVAPKSCADLAASALFGPWGFADAQSTSDFGVVDQNVTIPAEPKDQPIAGDQTYSLDARVFASKDLASSYVGRIRDELAACPTVSGGDLLGDATFQSVPSSVAADVGVAELAFQSSTHGEVALLQQANIVVWVAPRSGNSAGFADAVARFAKYMYDSLKYD